MPVIYLDPTGDLGLATTTYDLVADLDRRPLRLGLIANGFVDSDRFTAALAGELAGLLPEADLLRLEKPDPVAELTDEQLLELQGCDAAVVSYAH